MGLFEQTWQALLEGRDRITDLPDGRWSEFLEPPGRAGRRGPHPGGYLKDIRASIRSSSRWPLKADNIDTQQQMA